MSDRWGDEAGDDDEDDEEAGAGSGQAAAAGEEAGDPQGPTPMERGASSSKRKRVRWGDEGTKDGEGLEQVCRLTN